ncbi:hypothetical protein D6C77_09526 [Aureobasidium pullulans]|uniref:Uncharacterized protein n=1 Tax=Aureobasidium pullulans TaxID=5580 RepID=A0AB74JRG4_AURPU|nr:hypothetical protein D6D12_06085 [Aureobasidium pullulans]THX64068.1 hypothetical protein D6D11_01396 [Aureobasidium pullulans]TIA49585.1 hypothetical protein D6C77_09526 [Aureobasidium pullulans]TIA72951.1 hypothetical protein D6C76_06792 [Aureobasidium pullulans]
MHKDYQSLTMCFWRNVYYVDCKHYSRDPVACIEANHTDTHCEGWDDDDKEMQSQTRDGTPYTKALPGDCMDCKYRARLKKIKDSKSGGGPGGRGSSGRVKA